MVTRSQVLAAEETTTTEAVPVLVSATSSDLVLPVQSARVMPEERFQLTLQAMGGVAPYRWTIAPQSLPMNVYFDGATNLLWGAPLRSGQFSFPITVTDANGQTLTKDFTLNVGAETPVVATSTTVNNLTVTTTDPIIEPIFIDLDHLTDADLQLIWDIFGDDQPLIHIGTDAPTNLLKASIAQMRIKPNGLYRVEGGTPSTVNEGHKYSGVYYVDPNGRRHAFTTESAFTSWYATTTDSKIEAVPDWKLSNIPLSKNVTFRPGSVVRLEGTQEFYGVLPQRTLKKFADEATYQRLASNLKLDPMAITPVLPLAQVADYQFDAMTIKSLSDLPIIAQIPTFPGQEMVQE